MSRVFACGKDERELVRLGRETSWSWAAEWVELADEREETDF